MATGEWHSICSYRKRKTDMKKNRLLTTAGILLTALLISTHTAASNWPSWRGPSGNGISPEKNLPTTWSPTENVAWKIDLPGHLGRQNIRHLRRRKRPRPALHLHWRKDPLEKIPGQRQ